MCNRVSSLLTRFLACLLIHYSFERHIKGYYVCIHLIPLEKKKERRRNYTYITFFRKKNSGKLYNMMEKWGQRLIDPPGVRNPKFPFFAA
jgi:hypothetical protein